MKLFFKPSISTVQINNDLLKYTSIYYKVPRYGTTIIASIALYSGHLYDEEMYNKTEAILGKLRPEFKRIFGFTKLNLIWNKQEGKVEIGEGIP